MGGLAVGQMYEFQVWSNNSADNFHYGVNVHDDAMNSVLLSAGLGDVTPIPNYRLGQFVIGTFVADSNSQRVLFDPDEVTFVNGFQLRAIGAASVPEPSSIAVFGLAASVVTCFGWRRPNHGIAL